MLMRHTHDTTFSEKIPDFYRILEESEQFFIKLFTTSLTAGVRNQDQSSQVRQTSITHMLPFDWL
jgi:hypothetical protein